MTQGLAGPGVGLPYPQKLYPSQVANAPQDPSSNRIALNAGDTFVIPAGDWYIDVGSYCLIQYLNPTNNVWSTGPTPGWMGGLQYIKSDGFTTRVANLLGCVYSISILNAGSSYVQASTTLTVTGPAGVSAVAIVGGQLATLSVTNAGAGYGVAPLVMIPPPAPPSTNSNGLGGVAATAYAVIASGTVSAVSLISAGAGYQVAPVAVIVPSPFDPNLAVGITQAVATFSLVGSGSIVAAWVTNHGAPLGDGSLANVTIAAAGAGSSASLVANMLQTVKAGSVVGTGLGYGTVAVLMTSIGGGPNAGSISPSPDLLGLSFRPRPAQVSLTVTGGGTIAAGTGSVIDGGLFLSAPNVVVATNPLPGANVTVSGATLSFVMGSRPDAVTIQPAP